MDMLLPRRITLRTSGITFRAVCAVVFAMIALAGAATVFAQEPSPIPEQIEWTWEVRPQHPDAKLPNVLLLGDSIARNYFPQVTKDLEGVANVYLMASSTSVGDPRLPNQISEFSGLENIHFRVIYFNNGMHGWGYTEAQFKASFPLLIAAVRALAGKDGALVWANITPVKFDAPPGPTNPRIDARNAIALAIVMNENIPVDDQHSLMMKHLNLYLDYVHFNTEGANIMGHQAATTIRAALRK